LDRALNRPQTTVGGGGQSWMAGMDLCDLSRDWRLVYDGRVCKKLEKGLGRGKRGEKGRQGKVPVDRQPKDNGELLPAPWGSAGKGDRFKNGAKGRGDRFQ